MNRDLIDQLLREADAACGSDPRKMSEWLAGVVAGYVDLTRGSVSSGFVRGRKMGAAVQGGGGLGGARSRQASAGPSKG